MIGGRLGAGALRRLLELGDVAAASTSRLYKAAFMQRALAELDTCSLCRGNAGVYAGSMSRPLWVAGSAVQVGETAGTGVVCVRLPSLVMLSFELLCRSTCSIL